MNQEHLSSWMTQRVIIFVLFAEIYSLTHFSLIRRRLHDNDQSKNGEMYAYSAAAFWLFTRHRFVWNVGVAFSGEHAVIRLYAPYARTKVKEETLC